MSKRLFVGNLSYETSEADLVSAFQTYGATSAAIPTDHDGRGKGFGFVDISDDQLNPAIAAMNGREIAGRAVSVTEARPRTERTASGFGGTRGGERTGQRRW